MEKPKLKKVTIYLTPAEHQELKTEAEDYEVTMSAALRSKIGQE